MADENSVRGNTSDVNSELISTKEAVDSLTNSIDNAQTSLSTYVKLFNSLKRDAQGFSSSLKNLPAVPKVDQESVKNYSESLKTIYETLSKYTDISKSIKSFQSIPKTERDAVNNYIESLKTVYETLSKYSDISKSIKSFPVIPETDLENAKTYSEAIEKLVPSLKSYAESAKGIRPMPTIPQVTIESTEAYIDALKKLIPILREYADVSSNFGRVPWFSKPGNSKNSGSKNNNKYGSLESLISWMNSGSNKGAISAVASNALKLLNITTKAGPVLSALGVSITAVSKASQTAYDHNLKYARALESMNKSLDTSAKTSSKLYNNFVKLNNVWENFIDSDLMGYVNQIIAGITDILVTSAGIIGGNTSEPKYKREQSKVAINLASRERGMTSDTANIIADALYNISETLAASFDVLPSEMMDALSDAIISGSSAANKYGAVVNDHVLQGFLMSNEYRNLYGSNKDITNVEITDAMKEYYRYQLLMYELNADNKDALDKQIKAWTKLGFIIDKTKGKLFSFDEVINLAAVDPTIPDLGDYLESLVPDDPGDIPESQGPSISQFPSFPFPGSDVIDADFFVPAQEVIDAMTDAADAVDNAADAVNNAADAVDGGADAINEAASNLNNTGDTISGAVSGLVSAGDSVANSLVMGGDQVANTLLLATESGVLGIMTASESFKNNGILVVNAIQQSSVEATDNIARIITNGIISLNNAGAQAANAVYNQAIAGMKNVNATTNNGISNVNATSNNAVNNINTVGQSWLSKISNVGSNILSSINGLISSRLSGFKSASGSSNSSNSASHVSFSAGSARGGSSTSTALALNNQYNVNSGSNFVSSSSTVSSSRASAGFGLTPFDLITEGADLIMSLKDPETGKYDISKLPGNAANFLISSVTNPIGAFLTGAERGWNKATDNGQNINLLTAISGIHGGLLQGAGNTAVYAALETLGDLVNVGQLVNDIFGAKNADITNMGNFIDSELNLILNDMISGNDSINTLDWFNYTLSNIGSKNPMLYSNYKKSMGFASGGIGTHEIHNATLFEDNKREAVIPLESTEGIKYLSEALKEAQTSSGVGGDITVYLTLSGINIADNEEQWNMVGRKIAEVIAIDNIKRGDLDYGSSN